MIMREVGEDGHIEDDAVDATLVECMTRDLDRDRSGALLDLGLAYRSTEKPASSRMAPSTVATVVLPLVPVTPAITKEREGSPTT